MRRPIPATKDAVAISLYAHSFAEVQAPRRLPPGAAANSQESERRLDRRSRNGDGCRQQFWSNGNTEYRAADRYSAGAHHYFHGHHASYTKRYGYSGAAALARQAAEPGTRKQDRCGPGSEGRQAENQQRRRQLGYSRAAHRAGVQGSRRESRLHQG